MCTFYRHISFLVLNIDTIPYGWHYIHTVHLDFLLLVKVKYISENTGGSAPQDLQAGVSDLIWPHVTLALAQSQPPLLQPTCENPRMPALPIYCLPSNFRQKALFDLHHDPKVHFG